jgi:hypothetical protein
LHTPIFLAQNPKVLAHDHKYFFTSAMVPQALMTGQGEHALEHTVAADESSAVL